MITAVRPGAPRFREPDEPRFKPCEGDFDHECEVDLPHLGPEAIPVTAEITFLRYEDGEQDWEIVAIRFGEMRYSFPQPHGGRDWTHAFAVYARKEIIRQHGTRIEERCAEEAGRDEA